jgi:type II secretory pathway component PulC
MELLGVILDAATPSQSMCLIRCTYPADLRRTTTVQSGQTACDLAEIKEVRADSVIVRNVVTNRAERLRIRSTTGAPAPAPAEAAPPALVKKDSPGLVTVQLEKGTVEHYLANLPELLSSALATPHYSDTGEVPRRIDGFQLSQIQAGGAAERVGLKDGDIVQEINGEALDSIGTVLRLFSQAQTATPIKVTVMRQGQRLSIVLNTK